MSAFAAEPALNPDFQRLEAEFNAYAAPRKGLQSSDLLHEGAQDATRPFAQLSFFEFSQHVVEETKSAPNAQL